MAFLNGRTVSDSFAIAREALKTSPYVPDSALEGEKFILLPDVKEGGVDTELIPAEKPIFAAEAQNVDWPQPGHCTVGPNRTDIKKVYSPYQRLPSPPADFEGREVIMNNLIRNVLDRRLVSLVGEEGMGKSAVAAAVCKYLADREVFPDSIVYVKGKGVRDFRTFLLKLRAELQYCGHQPPAAVIMETTTPAAVGLPFNLSTSSLTSFVSTAPSLVLEEDAIFTCLRSLKLLLVLDNFDELLADYGEAVTDLRLFLTRLFDECPNVKLLNVAVDTLTMHNIQVASVGIVEYSVTLGPLTLNSALRLFARLAPSLLTAHEKADFIDSLQPGKQLHVSVAPREINTAALKILELLGDGHPAKIVHIACESTHESVEHLKKTGMKILRHVGAVYSEGSIQSSQQSSTVLIELVPPLPNAENSLTNGTSNMNSINTAT